MRKSMSADFRRDLTDDRAGGVDIGPTETASKQEIESEVVRRLAALEALDPSQARPKPKRNVWDFVDYFDP